MKVKANKRGFTLVELVVVIAILAIIAAIAIPCLINILDSTTASSGEAQAQTLNQVCQNAYNEIKAGTIKLINADSDNRAKIQPQSLM